MLGSTCFQRYDTQRARWSTVLALMSALAASCGGSPTLHQLGVPPSEPIPLPNEPAAMVGWFYDVDIEHFTGAGVRWALLEFERSAPVELGMCVERQSGDMHIRWSPAARRLPDIEGRTIRFDDVGRPALMESTLGSSWVQWEYDASGEVRACGVLQRLTREVAVDLRPDGASQVSRRALLGTTDDHGPAPCATVAAWIDAAPDASIEVARIEHEEGSDRCHTFAVRGPDGTTMLAESCRPAEGVRAVSQTLDSELRWWAHVRERPDSGIEVFHSSLEGEAHALVVVPDPDDASLASFEQVRMRPLDAGPADQFRGTIRRFDPAELDAMIGFLDGAEDADERRIAYTFADDCAPFVAAVAALLAAPRGGDGHPTPSARHDEDAP